MALLLRRFFKALFVPDLASTFGILLDRLISILLSVDSLAWQEAGGRKKSEIGLAIVRPSTG